MAETGIPPRAESCKVSPYNYLDGRCASCRFWTSGLSGFEDIAECRRYPPVRTDDRITGRLDMGAAKGSQRNIAGAGKWPVTNQADACGEYLTRG